MEIFDQMRIADNILSRLEIADPYCIVAGGAPRDWHFGNLANDIDVYYYTNADTMNFSKSQLKKLFPECDIVPLCEVSDRDSNMYSTMPFLRRIWNTEIEGVKVQFIQLSEPQAQFKVVKSMDVSICQTWYKDGKVNFTDNFKLGEVFKAMWTLNGCTWQDKHPKKMRERFPNYSLINEQQLQSMIKRKVLQGAN